MGTIYRDYGTLNDNLAANNLATIDPRRQVYQATHRGDGTRLPFMYRSFISFTYGGKPIEDFDLIATIVNDRLTKDAYAAFNDIVTTYDNLDGQYYWNTHYTTNSLTFILSTDGIDQKTLDDFRFWFHAGEAKELILAEHPNRAIMARVAQPPQLSVLPFEYDTTVMISGREYPMKTTLYKGDITLNFVMDEPHWYAIKNILGREDTSLNRYVDEWIDANGNTVDIFASQDALKILLEDGIPLGSMINKNMLLGNGAYANVENNVNTLIWTPGENEIVWDEGEPSGYGARIYGEITEDQYAHNSGYAAVTEEYVPLTLENGDYLSFDRRETDSPVEGAYLTYDDEEAIRAENNITLQFSGTLAYKHSYLDYHPAKYDGRIAGPIVDISGNGIPSLAAGTDGYFFYSGTAPSPTIISFEFIPTFNEAGYFNSIDNIYTNSMTPYNTITIESVSKQQLRFSTPNLITSYNKALKMISDSLWSGNIIKLQEQIIEEVRHPGVREWVMSLLSDVGNPSNIQYQTVKERMQQFFKSSEEEYAPMRFIFNSKTGEAIGQFYYRKPLAQLTLYNLIYAENAYNKILTLTSVDPNLTDRQRYENLVTWGWDIYCITGSNQLFVPSDDDISSYTRAINIFVAYYHECLDNGVDMPGIFRATPNPLSQSTIINATENVGDMLQSNNIIIYDRNYPTVNGNIIGWQDNTEDGKKYSHRIYHNLNVDLTHFQIQYRNMYL